MSAATQYAYPAMREGWDWYPPSGARRGDWRVTRVSGGRWHTFRVLPGFNSMNGPKFDTLEAAQDYIEGLEE